MKMLLIMAPTECLEELKDILEKHDIHGYTELPNVLGSGRSGARMGTRAFPGTTSLLMPIVTATAVPGLVDAIKEYCACREDCDLVRIFSVPAEQLL